MRQRLAVLGSTGSVGANTLDVAARHLERFEVFALSAARRVDLMLEQCERFRPAFAVMTESTAAAALEQKLQANGLPTRVLSGSDALETIAAHPQVDAVMAAIVGAAGLASCLAAARAGKRLLLANKEALVVGGRVFLDAVAAGGAQLLPIDSEHSAILQALPDDRASWQARVEKLIITGSGGPFRTRDPATLGSVTPDEACAHPNWVMGRKISVDSATMMNKALEVIEAAYLFGFAPERIEVLVHPQSVVHSMVQYRDGSVVAQLGTPDMRVPIAYGLAWPDRVDSGAKAPDLAATGTLSFEPPDFVRFPGLRLAWEVLAAPEGTSAVLNAANETAVQAFLDGRLRFDRIHAVNVETLQDTAPARPATLGDLLEIDAAARRSAQRAVAKMAG